jgi:hypothetical protein
VSDESHEGRLGSAAYSVPQAGAMVGLSRNGSYDAAKRGEIPTIQFGKKKVVPKALWDRKLGLTETVRGDSFISAEPPISTALPRRACTRMCRPSQSCRWGKRSCG